MSVTDESPTASSSYRCEVYSKKFSDRRNTFNYVIDAANAVRCFF
ncbi:hypothetical protein NIES2107_23490 [Nostoc carneum NIES-2107]|nr:hypothetical protein NIES2107_23490 [Nostoc carneum NIES-2107]